MQKDLATRLKLRPPHKFKKRGLRFSPKAKVVLEKLEIDEKTFLEEFNPQLGAHEIIDKGETLFQFYGRYNRSGLYMIHCRETAIGDKD